MRTQPRLSLPLALAAFGIMHSQPMRGQDARNDQFYFPGSFNWAMLKNYPEAARLFNAFDYGHAILYEKLYTGPNAPVAELEAQQFDYITTDLLIRPPRFAVAEEVIEPNYARLAWKAKLMFDWAHTLHRQVYDVYADERLSEQAKDSLVEVLTDYYLSNRNLAFSTSPKSMQLMDGQEFSQVFRQRYPKMNGLIWAYHWLQVGLYEPLIAGKTPAEKKAGVKAVLARFWSMVEDPPNRFPKVMPMTAAVAPEFSRRHPRAAVIFDNLHMMHDIISDVLASTKVPRDRKRAVIYQQLAEFQRSDQNTMTMDDWRNMGTMMGGVGVMGGPALGILLDPPTVRASAPEMEGMPGMDRGAPVHHADTMSGMGAGGDTVHKRELRGMADSAGGGAPAMDMGRDMSGMAMKMPGDSATQAHMRLMMEMHARMMADPVIHRRMMSDTIMQRLMEGMMASMPAGAVGGMMSKPGATDSVAAGHDHHPSAAPVGPKPRRPPAKKAKPATTDSMP
ncbi:MAG: hypothetical protein ABJD11_13570, partial [Gemmatimonadota bacterium]